MYKDRRYTPRNSYQAISKLSKNILENAAKQNGLSDFNLFLEWKSIVGEYFGNLVHPKKITFPPNQRKDGVLHIKTTSYGITLVQHSKEQIISKINTYFGYKAISDVKATIWPIKKSVENKPFFTQKQTISDQNLSIAETIETPSLKKALLDLMLHKL